MPQIQIGIIAQRGDDGRFLPPKPIYRDIPEDSEPKGNYLPMDELTELFADKYKSYLKLKRLEKKENSSHDI